MARSFSTVPTHTVRSGLDEMPPDMPLLLTATQDPRFFDHGGVDVLGIARAVLANVTHLGLNEGASTLTMRLAKTSLTGASPTLARKII
jgi:penicillin-binding protein 1A